MTQPGIFRQIVSGEAGLWATPVRAGLRIMEVGYAAAVASRNKRYDRSGPHHTVDVPVISVGNLTVGGTGKTPVVIDLLGRLKEIGYSPGVVARGYKAEDNQPNDEELVIRSHCPGVVYVANPDRAAGAEAACRKFGVDVIVLDDGFQHRRLARDLDIVLVDATCPFGYDHILPRGLLREPVSSLERADVIIVTRCDQVSDAQLADVSHRIERYTGDAPILRSSYRVYGVEALGRYKSVFSEPRTSVRAAVRPSKREEQAELCDTTTKQCPDRALRSDSLEGKRVVLFAGIANPLAFHETVRSLGAEIVGERWWPDHHRYRASDVQGMQVDGAYPPYDWMVTTEKDAVKLSRLLLCSEPRTSVRAAPPSAQRSPSSPNRDTKTDSANGGLDQARIAVVKAEIDFLADSDTLLQAALQHTLSAFSPVRE